MCLLLSAPRLLALVRELRQKPLWRSEEGVNSSTMLLNVHILSHIFTICVLAMIRRSLVVLFLRMEKSRPPWVSSKLYNYETMVTFRLLILPNFAFDNGVHFIPGFLVCVTHICLFLVISFLNNKQYRYSI